MRKGYEGINALTVLIIGIMVLSIVGLGYYLFVSNQIAFFKLLPNFNSSKTEADKVQIIGYEIGTDHLQYYDAGGKWMNFPLDADKSFEKESGGYSMNFGDKIVMYKPTWESLRDYYYNSNRGSKSSVVNGMVLNINSLILPQSPPNTIEQEYDKFSRLSSTPKSYESSYASNYDSSNNEIDLNSLTVLPFVNYYSDKCFIYADKDSGNIIYPSKTNCIPGGIQFSYQYSSNEPARSFVYGADNRYYLAVGEFDSFAVYGTRIEKKNSPVWRVPIYKYDLLESDKKYMFEGKEISGDEILLKTKDAFETVRVWRDSILSKPITLSYIDVKQKGTVKQTYCVRKVKNILTVDLTVPSNGDCLVNSR